MTTMEKSGNKFEKVWKEIFQEAEVAPREEVWTKIDSALANQEIKGYKKKLLIYKLLAAASIIFALGIGFFSTTDIFKSDISFPDLTENQIIPELIYPDSGENDTRNMLQSPDKNQQLLTADQGESEKNMSKNQKNIRLLNEPLKNEQLKENIVGDVSYEENDNLANSIYFSINDQYIRDLPVLATRLNVNNYEPVYADTPKKRIDPFAENWLITFEDPFDKNRGNEPEFWAGLNFSSGIFNPNISYGDNPSNLGDQLAFMSNSGDAIEAAPESNNSIASIMRATQPEESTYNSEFSYAYGVNVGYKISSKFIIRGGISYVFSNSSTQINSYIENSATNHKIPNQALYSVNIESAGVTSINNTSEEIKLNSSYEFISLPFNFGYYLIDKKFEWMLTAGITTDFFLKNTIQDPSNFLESKEIRAGGDSPYNTAYLNGTLGTLVNVSFADHYRFSLEPSYRLGLSSFAKDQVSFTSRPTSFMFTAGISYIFR